MKKNNLLTKKPGNIFMKTKCRQLFFILIFISLGDFCFAVVAPTSLDKEISAVEKSKQPNKLDLNQSLSFKERIILKNKKRKERKNRKRAKNSKKLSRTALIGFILSLTGFGILGLIFSLKALKKFKQEDADKRGKKSCNSRGGFRYNWSYCFHISSCCGKFDSWTILKSKG